MASGLNDALDAQIADILSNPKSGASALLSGGGGGGFTPSFGPASNVFFAQVGGVTSTSMSNNLDASLSKDEETGVITVLRSGLFAFTAAEFYCSGLDANYVGAAPYGAVNVNDAGVACSGGAVITEANATSGDVSFSNARLSRSNGTLALAQGDELSCTVHGLDNEADFEFIVLISLLGNFDAPADD